MMIGIFMKNYRREYDQNIDLMKNSKILSIVDYISYNTMKSDE